MKHTKSSFETSQADDYVNGGAMQPEFLHPHLKVIQWKRWVASNPQKKGYKLVSGDSCYLSNTQNHPPDRSLNNDSFHPHWCHQAYRSPSRRQGALPSTGIAGKVALSDTTVPIIKPMSLFTGPTAFAEPPISLRGRWSHLLLICKTWTWPISISSTNDYLIHHKNWGISPKLSPDWEWPCLCRLWCHYRSRSDQSWSHFLLWHELESKAGSLFELAPPVPSPAMTSSGDLEGIFQTLVDELVYLLCDAPGSWYWTVTFCCEPTDSSRPPKTLDNGQPWSTRQSQQPSE